MKASICMATYNKDRCVNRGAGYVASAVLNAGHELEFFDTAYCSVRDVFSESVLKPFER